MKHSELWDRNIHLLEKYYILHGNSDVPKSYVMDGFKLGVWVFALRRAYVGIGTMVLNEERIEQLKKYNFKWDIREANWEEYYSLLEDYYKKHGNIRISPKYVVKGKKLGSWLSNQKQAYAGKSNNKISKLHIMYLNDMNIDWSIQDTRLLNSKITRDNSVKYRKVMINRLNHILDDLIFEQENSDYKFSQKEVEGKIIKRMFR